MRTSLRHFLSRCWRALRRVSGDDAYERYVVHQATNHPDLAPLSRADFFRSEQKRKWEGVRRCC